DVKTLRSEFNLGFAKACNLGAENAAGKLLCFLNNDTEVTKGWLTALVNCLKRHPQAAAAGGRLLFPDGTVQHAGIVFDKIDRIGYHIYRGFPADAPEVSRERKVKAVTAACMLVKKDAFKQAGGFDEDYWNGFEDVDLSLKLGESGGEIYYTPACRVIHHTSATPGRKDADIENAQLFQRKWYDKIQPDEDIFLAEDGWRAIWEGTTCKLKKITCDIFIPFKDNPEEVEACVEKVITNTVFPNYTIKIAGAGVDKIKYLRVLYNRVDFVELSPLESNRDITEWAVEHSNADIIITIDSGMNIKSDWLIELVKWSASVNVKGWLIRDNKLQSIDSRRVLPADFYDGIDGFFLR
nr:glycosyltransferase [FCB group bacterium]